MTSRIFSQSIERHYILTTSLTTRTAIFRQSTRRIPSITSIRTFQLSHQHKLQASQNRIQSKTSKAFPEAMDAIKQTVAQNLGIGVCTLSIFHKKDNKHSISFQIFLRQDPQPHVPYRRCADTKCCIGGS